jgi:hypothetical protein
MNNCLFVTAYSLFLGVLRQFVAAFRMVSVIVSMTAQYLTDSIVLIFGIRCAIYIRMRHDTQNALALTFGITVLMFSVYMISHFDLWFVFVR